MAKSANTKKQEANKLNTTLAVKATFKTLEAFSDVATRACGFGVCVLVADAEGKQRGGVHTWPVKIFAASQYGNSKHACAGKFKAGHARVLLSQALTLKEAIEHLAKAIYTLQFHKPIDGMKSLEPRKADTFTGADLKGTVGKAEWKWARSQIANDTARLSKLYWVSMKVSTSATRADNDAKKAAEKAESQKEMSEDQKALSDFREANNLPLCKWAHNGRKMPKMPLDDIEYLQATTMTKAMAKRVVINTADLTKAKAYREDILPLIEAANKSKPATASTAEKSQADTKAQAKRKAKVDGVKATQSLRAEGAQAS